MTPTQTNDVANYIALAADVLFLIVGTQYIIGPKGARFAPFQSAIGGIQSATYVSIVLVLTIVVLRRFYGDYPGYQYIAVGGYSALAATGIALAIAIPIARRSLPAPPPPTESETEQ